MKRYFLLIILLFNLSLLYAQHEVTEVTDEPILLDTKSFGGFLIDMTLMNLQAPPRFSDFKLELPNVSKDYSQLFSLNPNMTFSQGNYSSFSAHSTGLFTPWGWGNHPATLQMSSFRLKNGMRLNTYGQYNKEGRKVYDPSALPWERNDFKGAFELKSANGAFGIRIEVQQNR